MLLLMDSCRSHEALSDPEARIQVLMFPPDASKKQQPVIANTVVVTKPQYGRRLLPRRTSLLAEPASLRAWENLMYVRAGIPGLPQAYPPHLLDATRPLRDTWNEVSQRMITE